MGTQKNVSYETVIFEYTKHMLKHTDKKILTILHIKSSLIRLVNYTHIADLSCTCIIFRPTSWRQLRKNRSGLKITKPP